MRSREVALSCLALECGYDERVIVPSVDAEIARGELVCIVGPSGCGKSTLLYTLMGLVPPISGEIRILGRLLPDGLDQSLLSRLGVLFQNDALIGSMTVLENLALPLRELAGLPEDLASYVAQSRLALMGVGGLGSRLPGEISGGQRRRVALARASMLDPEVIFCDEPTAGLDPSTEIEMIALLERLRDLEITILAVTHSLRRLTRRADRVWAMGRDGHSRIGTLDELASQDDREVQEFLRDGEAIEHLPEESRWAQT